jgi:hypothetical protein
MFTVSPRKYLRMFIVYHPLHLRGRSASAKQEDRVLHDAALFVPETEESQHNQDVAMLAMYYCNVALKNFMVNSYDWVVTLRNIVRQTLLGNFANHKINN